MLSRFAVMRWLASIVGVWLGLLVGVQVAAAQTDAPQAETIQTQRYTLRDFGQGDLTARTRAGSVSYYVPLPAHRVPVAGSELTLLYSHSPLLDPTRSTMTIWVNGVALDSVQLTLSTHSRAQLRIPLPIDTPAAPMRVPGYFIEIRFRLSLTHDECEEFDNPAQWATIHGESELHLVTAAMSDPPGLEALDRLFTPLRAADGLPTLALPPAPSAQEVAAAGILAFQLGRWAAAIGADAPITITHDVATPPDGSYILVATQDRLPPGSQWGDLTWDGNAFTRDDQRAGPGQGVLALTLDSAPQLLVSGPAATLEQAATAIVDPARRALLFGSHTLLTEGTPAPLPLSPAWQGGRATFSALGLGEAQRVSGHGEHQLDFYQARPPGWTLRPGSRLELAIAASPALRAQSSWVAATVNGLEIGSLPLQIGGGVRSYSFELPVEALNQTPNGIAVRDLHIRLRIMLDLPLRECESVDADTAWAAVTPASSWRLEYRPTTTFDLGRFPWPLYHDSDTMQPWSPIVAMADTPDDDDLQAGLQIMAALGRWTGGNHAPLPRLLVAGSVSPNERNQALITLGDATRNSLVAALVQANALPAQADAAIASQLGAPTGDATLRLVRSPWNRNRAVLAVTAGDAGGLLTAARGLAGRAIFGKLRGQTAVVSTGPTPQILVDSRPVPSLWERFAPALLRGLTPPQVVATGLLLALLAVLMILWRAYRRRLKAMS